ncbi:hypothetical protein ABFX02_13G079100 [Erythranthe guttata]
MELFFVYQVSYFPQKVHLFVTFVLRRNLQTCGLNGLHCSSESRISTGGCSFSMWHDEKTARPGPEIPPPQARPLTRRRQSPHNNLFATRLPSPQPVPGGRRRLKSMARSRSCGTSVYAVRPRRGQITTPEIQPLRNTTSDGCHRWPRRRRNILTGLIHKIDSEEKNRVVEMYIFAEMGFRTKLYIYTSGERIIN